MSDTPFPQSELVEPKTLKGFQDLFPQEMLLRNSVVRTIQGVYEKYGFLPIDTPVLEHIETLVGTGGEETNKTLFRLNSPEEDPVAMRFDLTVPFARLIAQYPDRLSLPFRRYHIGPVFRVDKPGPGRYRQFTQFDIDAAGSRSVAVDAEIIAAMCDAMRAVGFANGDAADAKRQFTIRINNRKLVDALLMDAGVANPATASHVLRVVDKLLKVGLDNVRRELGPGRMDESGDRIRGVGLDNAVIDKVLSFIAIPGGARCDVLEAIRTQLSESDIGREAIKQMNDLADMLDALGVGEKDAVFDPSLARGLDYYTGPVFETILPGAPEFGSVMGGGRYDGLVKRFSNLSVPATGASIGLDRFLAAVRQLGGVDLPATTVQVLVLTMSGVPVTHLLTLVGELRRSGIPSQIFFPAEVEGAAAPSMRNQLSFANAVGIPVAVIVGEDELKTDRVSIKDLRAGKEKRAGIEDRNEYRKAGKTAQVTVARSELVATVRDMLGPQAQDTFGGRAPTPSPGIPGGG